MEDMREPMAFEEENWVCEVKEENKFLTFLRFSKNWLWSLLH